VTSAPSVSDHRLAEVADRIWVGSFDGNNATVVAGGAGLLLVDALGSHQAADELVEQVRRLGRGDVLAVALTHGHDDHVTGLPVVRAAWPGCEVHAHEEAGVAGADRPFSSVGVVALGDRVAELVHAGRAHSASDTVVRVPDADVLAAGDLVSRAGPDYGEDCYPLDWPATLDLAVGMLTSRSLVVPGHGALLDRPAAQEQRADAGTVAETIFDLAARSVAEEEALDSVEWPWPAERLRFAVPRGYAMVPRTERRLPLV
jgi:glyoxylase-like metal-dependent hydrolase (beta-lactamase superfamily II)